MGVNLRGIVNPTKTTLEEFRGKRLAIDSFNALYQFLSIIRGMSGDLLRDSKNRVTSHLSGLFYRNVNLIETGIKPLYVFDGEPPRLKATTIEHRREVKQVAAKMYAQAIEREEYEAARKFASATAYLTAEMVEESKTLLDFMGIPWIQAPSEGEASAAQLTQAGAADYAASQDYDSLLFGAKRLARNITISGKRKVPNSPVRVDVIPEFVVLDEVLSSSGGITQEQLVDIGILLGTDFNPHGFKGIGPATALRLIKKYGEIEKIPQLKDKLSFDPNDIRQIFLNPQVIQDMPSETDLRKPDREALMKFLCDERAFSRERVESALSRMDQISKVRDESLEQWFH